MWGALALDIIKNIKPEHSGANITASLREIRNKTTSSLQNFFARKKIKIDPWGRYLSNIFPKYFGKIFVLAIPRNTLRCEQTISRATPRKF